MYDENENLEVVSVEETTDPVAVEMESNIDYSDVAGKALVLGGAGLLIGLSIWGVRKLHKRKNKKKLNTAVEEDLDDDDYFDDEEDVEVVEVEEGK